VSLQNVHISIDLGVIVDFLDGTITMMEEVDVIGPRRPFDPLQSPSTKK
jgi:hypothetical protein